MLPTPIDYNKIYSSKKCGEYKIIKDLGNISSSGRYVRIKFIKTGTEKDVEYHTAIAGNRAINDELHGIDFNKIYNSFAYGPYQIIKYIGKDSHSRRIVRVKFLNTLYETNVRLEAAKNGYVKDNTIAYSDRYFSLSKTDSEYNLKIIEILKNRWQLMMQRCYNKNKDNFNEYGELGITVAKEWQNVDNYILSMPSIPYFYKFYDNPLDYQLDKDLLQLNIPKSNRIYSPKTSVFLSYSDNLNLAKIESHNPNEYYGIKFLTNNTYKVLIKINGTYISFGIYSNLLAAANAYNYYYSVYGSYELIPLLNKVEYMPITEVKKYLVSINKINSLKDI